MPVDRGAIDAQLREIGEGERWWEQREFRDLPHILHADEKIQGVINGWLVTGRRPRIMRGAPWLIVATTQRLLLLKQERFARRQVEIPAGEIVRVHQGSRLRALQITIQTRQRRYRIRIAREDAFRFAGALAPLMPGQPAQAVQTLHPDLEAWSWVPGLTTVASFPGVAGLVSRVSMLSTPEYATREHVERLEATVERLHHEVRQLQQQVAFLEDLLQKRAEEAYLPPARVDSERG